MEVKINREIRNYTESLFFGLSIRQFFFSCLGCLGAVISYFMFKNSLGLEITSWICMLVAAPFIAIGFIKYNGMPMEKFFVAWLKTEVLTSKKLKFESKNFYYEAVANYIKEKEDIKK